MKQRLENDKTIEYDENGVWVNQPCCTADSLIKKVLDQCHDVRKRHKQTEADEYADAGRYRELVRTMLETSAMAKSKLLGWMEDEKRVICLDFACPLRTCHRERISFLLRNLPTDREKRKERAQMLCIELGLAVKLPARRTSWMNRDCLRRLLPGGLSRTCCCCWTRGRR